MSRVNKLFFNQYFNSLNNLVNNANIKELNKYFSLFNNVKKKKVKF